MTSTETVRTDVRGSYVGTIVCAAFGLAWTGWGAGDLPSPAGPVVGVLGAAVGLTVIVIAVRRLRSAPAGSGRSMTGTRSYWVVCAVEVVAIVGGSVLLGRFGHPELVVVWTSAVVGVHFLAFGRMFWSGFAVLGAVLLVGALAGLVLFWAGLPHVIAVTALVAAVGLLGFATRAAVRRS